MVWNLNPVTQPARDACSVNRKPHLHPITTPKDRNTTYLDAIFSTGMDPKATFDMFQK